METQRKIVKTFQVGDVSETYNTEDIKITDLKESLGTKGHVLVIRGDKAYGGRLKDKQLANPKFWMYANLINSPRVQRALQ